MGAFARGEFTPKNPDKYIGKMPIVFRSSWEFSMMSLFDKHPNVIAWASESLSIPYQNPLTGRQTVYIPDFFVQYMDKTGKQHVEVIEVKPLKETPGYKGKQRLTEKLKMTQAINFAKWAAAAEFCARRGWFFRVATEKDLFGARGK